MKKSNYIVAVVAAVFSFSLAVLPAGAQGFGSLSKKKISLRRKLPASAHLPGSTVQIKVTSRDAKNNDIAAQVADLLETELLKYDKNLKIDQAKPESVITCVITNYSLPPAESITKNVMTEKKIGKDVRSIEEPKRFYLIKGSLDMTYQAKDARSDKVVDSDTIAAKYSGEFDADSGDSSSDSAMSKGLSALKTPWKKVSGKPANDQQSAPTTSELQQMLAKQAAVLVSGRLVNTDETVDVLLARGKLDEADKMAEAGLWDRYLEALEQMPPFPNKADDAYRLYNIGVAYEALGYKAEDAKAAKKFFDQAAINYGKAVDAKPGEKYFLEPQTRIETALAHYRKMEQQPTVEAQHAPEKTQRKAEDKNAEAEGKTAQGKTASKTKEQRVARAAKPPVTTAALKEKATAADLKPSTDTPPLTNDQVIKLFKAGMDEENLVSTINEARNTHFDMSVDGQLQLVGAGVKGKILTAMRHKANSQSHNSRPVQ